MASRSGSCHLRTRIHPSGFRRLSPARGFLCPKCSAFCCMGPRKKMDTHLAHPPASTHILTLRSLLHPLPPHLSNQPPGRGQGSPLCRGSEAPLSHVLCLLCVSGRMGLVSSKKPDKEKPIKEKDKGQWSPLKVSAQDKDAPPLPPLVSDCPPPPRAGYLLLLCLNVHICKMGIAKVPS